MDFELMPMIRFEIEGIKAQVLRGLGLYGSKLGEYVEKQIDQAFHVYDFERTVSEAITRGFDKAIYNLCQS